MDWWLIENEEDEEWIERAYGNTLTSEEEAQLWEDLEKDGFLPPSE